MGSKFEDLMRKIEEEAEAEGPDALEELRLFKKYYAKVREDVLASGMEKLDNSLE